MRRFLIPLLLLASLAACGSPPPPPGGGEPEVLKGGVMFRYRNSDAKKVYVVGDFNDWSPTADPMADDNGDGQWTLFYPLAPGRYAYKFVVDGKNWISDSVNPESEPDGFDGRNSVVVVPSANP
jgi:1,4-alpha-glucan branching enzyme